MQGEKIKKIISTILFYYAVFLSAILIVVGFWVAKTSRDYISAVIFIPLLIFILSNYKEFYKIK
jgi:hypothetical protein